jgi:uncharacterized protein (DUF4415 family)
MKTKQKKKVGRPVIQGNTKKSRMVYISQDAYDFYLLNGGGNFSKGVQVIFENIKMLKD